MTQYKDKMMEEMDKQMSKEATVKVKISTPKKLTSTPTSTSFHGAGAVGGISEEEEFWLYKKKFIQDFMKLNNQDDVEDFLEDKFKHTHIQEPSHIEHVEHITSQNFKQIPRLSTFYGEENKGEVNWKSYKFEIRSLQEEKFYSTQQILLGIRRSTKGTASDILRRLGTGVGIEEIISKLESTFGDIETKESCLRQFYACLQTEKESVAQYATRLEELYSQAVALGGLKKGEEIILKNVFYQGLKGQIKTISAYKHDAINDYDRFKIEVRKIEADLNTPQKKEETHKINSAINVGKLENKSEMREVKELLQTINDRVGRLEADKDKERYNTGYSGYRGGGGDTHVYRGREDNSGYRGARVTNGYRGRGRGSSNFQDRGRGRGALNTNRGGFRGRGARVDYSQRNPTNNGDTRTCYNCNEIGHIARNCPKE